MSQAHNWIKRDQIVSLRQEGNSLKEISEILAISYTSVLTIHKSYIKLGALGLEPQYKNCGSDQSDYSADIIESCLGHKRLHMSWGAPRIRVDMVALWGEEAAPCIRSLQRWYRKEGLIRPNRQPAEPSIGKSRAVHNIWQVDAKENLVLEDGTEACYLTMVDEKSGAWLASPVFPPQEDLPSIRVRSSRCAVSNF